MVSRSETAEKLHTFYNGYKNVINRHFIGIFSSEIIIPKNYFKINSKFKIFALLQLYNVSEITFFRPIHSQYTGEVASRQVKVLILVMFFCDY